ncbi:MAG: UDP-N-acetylglucosamine--LPS N-acetylglucosamine transferase [Planctomycetes bacterium]|nr:UDP-N-acetylglucosamine--LPS N-acetylglucosamine transferase [Planctomycetota bacterium]
MAPRILVLSASVGAGHLRAAEAVDAALRLMVPEATVRNIDVLDMTNALFRRVYGKLYLDLVNKAPHVLGHFYDLLDRPSKSGKYRGDRFRLVLEKLNLRNFVKFLREEPWDLIINTHFLPAEIIASLRKQKLVSMPHTTVTTDFDTHRLWVNQPCERYFTATPEGALYLEHWGVPKKDIVATGIPIHPVFSSAKDRRELLAKHKVDGERPIIVQIAGGFGVGPVEKLFLAILQIERPIQLVSITGRNEKLKGDLEKLPVPSRHKVKVFGFTKEIDELMLLADLVLSKPGGLTTSETLARGAVMAIVNPIPGQESRNSDYLLEAGAAIKINNAATAPFKIGRLLDDPRKLQSLRDNVKRIARPRAAFDVVEKSLELLRDVAGPRSPLARG